MDAVIKLTSQSSGELASCLPGKRLTGELQFNLYNKTEQTNTDLWLKPQQKAQSLCEEESNFDWDDKGQQKCSEENVKGLNAATASNSNMYQLSSIKPKKIILNSFCNKLVCWKADSLMKNTIRSVMRIKWNAKAAASGSFTVDHHGNHTPVYHILAALFNRQADRNTD